MNDLNGEEIVGTFYENELQNTQIKEFRIGKVIKRKDNKWKMEKNVKWNHITIRLITG